MSEEQAHEFYKDPEHLAISGPGRRRQRQRPMKTAMIPVRFTQEMIAAVKGFACQDGVTVSTWIRGVIAKEIQRRQPPATASAAVTDAMHLDYPPEFRPQSESVSSFVPALCAG
jgi:hypothetical protein